MTKILFTGGEWGRRKGTTAEVTVDTDLPRPHAFLGEVPVCLEGCFEPNAVEVPYLIGEKVRLTGDKWLDPGTIREISGYWYSSAKDAWLPVLDSGYLVIDDWTVEPVATGGFTGIKLGGITDISIPEMWNLKFIKHPNFVQVSVKVPTLSSEYDKSYSAYREDEYSPWEILSTEIEDVADIKGLRKVLDEIERRVEADS